MGKLTANQKRAAELYASGVSAEQAAKTMGLSVSWFYTLVQKARRNGVDVPPRGPVYQRTQPIFIAQHGRALSDATLREFRIGRYAPKRTQNV